MSVPTFVDVVDALRIMARRLTDLERLTRDHETRLDEIATTLYDPPLPPAAADSGPVLCPNCGEPMYWHVEHEGYTTTKFYSCGGPFSCYLDTISFTPTTDESEAAAIVRRMRGAR